MWLGILPGKCGGSLFHLFNVKQVCNYFNNNQVVLYNHYGLFIFRPVIALLSKSFHHFIPKSEIQSIIPST